MMTNERNLSVRLKVLPPGEESKSAVKAFKDIADSASEGASKTSGEFQKVLDRNREFMSRSARSVSTSVRNDLNQMRADVGRVAPEINRVLDDLTKRFNAGDDTVFLDAARLQQNVERSFLSSDRKPNINFDRHRSLDGGDLFSQSEFNQHEKGWDAVRRANEKYQKNLNKTSDLLEEIHKMMDELGHQDSGSVGRIVSRIDSGDQNALSDLERRHRRLRDQVKHCLLYTSPSPRDATLSRMPSSA